MKNYFKLNIALLSSALYVSFELFSNILSTKIALVPFINLAVDGGTVIYPLTFTLRDFVHKTWGKHNARQVVVIAGLLNLVMVALFWLVGKMTPDPAWNYQSAYDVILLPVMRITIASIISQIISELIDTEIFSRVYRLTNDLAAVLISNFFSVIIDSIVFSCLAFLGNFSVTVLIQIIITNIIIKLIISLISAPTIKLIPRTVNFEEI
ncbi:MAG: queuosine precursor transporter [Candidatus Buchananbacteria bacterium]